MSDFNLGDVLSLIIVIAIYLTAASSSKKKKNRRKQRAPMRSRVQGEQRDERSAKRDAQTHAGFGDAFAPVSASKVQERCDTRQMHLHEVTQQQFEYAGEGEDPCHAGGFSAQEEEYFGLPDDENREALAQDVLRGVVMSEILTRPQQRAALRRGGR